MGNIYISLNKFILQLTKYYQIVRLRIFLGYFISVRITWNCINTNKSGDGIENVFKLSNTFQRRWNNTIYNLLDINNNYESLQYLEICNVSMAPILDLDVKPSTYERDHWQMYIRNNKVPEKLNLPDISKSRETHIL